MDICYSRGWLISSFLYNEQCKKIEDQNKIVGFAGKKFIFTANKFLSTFLSIYLKSMCQVVELRSDKHLFKTAFSIKFPAIQKLM